MLELNEKVTCADGFTMSVQANENAYCTPRVNGAPSYTQVEVGFPNAPEGLLMRWAEDPHYPTQTVYAYVPSEVILDVCAKHGGVVGGRLPPGITALEGT